MDDGLSDLADLSDLSSDLSQLRIRLTHNILLCRQPNKPMRMTSILDSLSNQDTSAHQRGHFRKVPDHDFPRAHRPRAYEWGRSRG